jgi:sugar O-acyltransferase (sialic acid O-acetyltransferase NeuD family)
MKKLAIIGSGDLGQQIAYHAVEDNQFDVVGFFDDYKNEGDLVNNIPILGKIEDILPMFSNGVFDELLIGVGYKHMSFRSYLYDQFKGVIPFSKLIHSSSFVDTSSIIDNGVVIYPCCIIDKNVKIGNNVLINIGCCIAHDSEIGAHSFLSPRVAIAGFVIIEDKCIIGINSTIIDNLRIVGGSQIGGGSVVIKSIQEEGLYVGNPVRFVR